MLHRSHVTRLLGAALAASLTLGLGACGSMSHQEKSAVIGTAVGGAVGAAATGSTLGAVGGAVVGGVVGNEVGKKK
ncbi:glycine zipper domain-containing protein [Roseateles violae]|uniref:Glycine zipper domain-containing protein n=1 Tax=Roseateles violae TaxID=3058042 RepID=A0ABT8DYF9_9BURK|nr:glycine zipper domain-containing protein [Pelomonas sp. PFR6]MDN3922619.1 glycine zipper domain-containing protein [Pelomonas sp. PFR6]